MKITIIVILALLVVAVVIFIIAFIKYRARMQHYTFAHQYLPKQMFAEPYGVLVPMVDKTGFSAAGLEHLRLFWEAAGEGFGGKDLVSSDALTYSMVVLGDPNSTAFLIELPPPEKKTEAHFVLMVFDAAGLCCNAVRHLRYFVLENYGEKDGAPKTQLGEWVRKADGSLKYADHGAGPLPTKQDFMWSVQKIIEESGSQPKAASQA